MSSPPSPSMRPVVPSLHNPAPQQWGPPTSYATKADKLCYVMVGLPARGKSYIARRLAHFANFFYGCPTKVFNVGDYRRINANGSFQAADFFDANNQEAMEQRRKASSDAVDDLTQWMRDVTPRRLDRDDLFLSGDFGAIAILDATNSTRERRAWVVDKLRPTGAKVIFIESICDDEDRVLENIMTAKVDPDSSKDYGGIEPSAAVADFQQRIQRYKEVYETLDEKHLSWIKLVDGGREVSMNNIRGFLPSRIAQFLVNLHVQKRAIYLSRHGQSKYNQQAKIGGDSGLTEHGEAYARALGTWVDQTLVRGSDGQPLPTRLWTSSLLRTRMTARHISHPTIILENGTEWVQMRPKVFRNLDEIYAGLCDGMTYEEIEHEFPEEAAARKADKFQYRYPRGESYTDLIARLEPLAHEIERLREPILIVAHQAILRVLYSYFMGYPRESCIDASIPLNTVIRITPTSRGCEEERIVVLEHPKGEQLDPASH